MGHSKDFKERAVSYRLEGHTVKETSKIFGIGTDTLNRWLRQYRETGSLSEKPLNRTFRKINPEKLKSILRNTQMQCRKKWQKYFIVASQEFAKH
ncbi:MAG: helix-turn-helix domain containing protein [Oscillospiraceae bacterium]|nr:helix-turn-helix domain containing protein [Oscillospiraceae bacterium]